MPKDMMEKLEKEVAALVEAQDKNNPTLQYCIVGEMADILCSAGIAPVQRDTLRFVLDAIADVWEDKGIDHINPHEEDLMIMDDVAREKIRGNE